MFCLAVCQRVCHRTRPCLKRIQPMPNVPLEYVSVYRRIWVVFFIRWHTLVRYAIVWQGLYINKKAWVLIWNISIAHFHQVPCSFGICEQKLKVKLPMFLILSVQLLSTFTNVFSSKETFLYGLLIHLHYLCLQRSEVLNMQNSRLLSLTHSQLPPSKKFISHWERLKATQAFCRYRKMYGLYKLSLLISECAYTWNCLLQFQY
jgi:hypothetical protein